LAAARNAPLKRVGAGENARDQVLQARRRRTRHFAIDDVVRQIRREPHLRDQIQQLNRHEQIIGDAIAMRLELNRHRLLLGDAQPAFDDRHHLGQPNRHFLTDDDHERRGDSMRQRECRSQGLDRLRKSRQASGEAGAREVRHGCLRFSHAERAQIDRHAVETGCMHEIEFLGE